MAFDTGASGGPGGNDPGVDPKKSRAGTQASLIDALIVILVSAGLTIFVFWLATTIVGGAVLSSLPDFIQNPFKAIWSSALTSGTGIGLAIERALQTRDTVRPDYMKQIGLAAGAMVVVTPAVAFMFKPN